MVIHECTRRSYLVAKLKITCLSEAKALVHVHDKAAPSDKLTSAVLLLCYLSNFEHLCSYLEPDSQLAYVRVYMGFSTFFFA